MIRFLDMIGELFYWGYVIVFFWMIHTFLPVRKNWPVRILAFWLCNWLASVIIYSNDIAGILGALLGFGAYIVVFHQGRWIEKVTAVLVFYPALIAVNYLMMDIGSRCFFGTTGAPVSSSLGWTQEQHLISTAIYTASLLLRLLFWLGAWLLLKKYLRGIASNLTVKMWLIVDMLMLASFVAIFTIIYFMPRNTVIVYPICGASLFSSFGCIYLASYISTSVQTAYHAQELEMRQAYYSDRLRSEERVRSIYHDLKNHLLVLQTQTGNGHMVQESARELQSQIEEYENYQHTGNEFLDMIIRDKARAAREKQIDFCARLLFEDGGFIEPLDISTIFGNAIDNAIEASEKLPEERRMITVKADRIRDMLVIIVENYMLSGTAVFGNTTKQDAFMHGFGIPNIKKAVERYGGQCIVKTEDEMFLLKIIIPIP